MPLLQTIIGKETQKGSSAQVFIFHAPRPEQRHLSETHLNKVAAVPEHANIVRKNGATPPATPAVLGVKPMIGGEWTQQAYEVGEGEIVKIFVSRKQEWNAHPNTACLFLQMRATGPLLKIAAKLLGKPSSRFKVAEFTGRCDVLTMEEALQKGIKIADAYRHFFHPQNVGKCFVVEQLEAPIADKPSVSEKAVTVGGEVRVLQTRVRRRALE